MIRSMGLMAERTITTGERWVLNLATLPDRKIVVAGGAKIRTAGNQKTGMVAAMRSVAVHTAAGGGRWM